MTTEADTEPPARREPRNRQASRRVEAAVAAIHEDARAIERRELATAIDRLEARGDLDEDRREALAAVAGNIVDRVLATPTERLRRAGDPAVAHTALALFEPERSVTGRRPAATRPEGSDGE